MEENGKDVSPFHLTGGMEERRELSQQGPGRALAENSFIVI